MDKLANQLREDASKIDVAVSPELDDRIRASLHGEKQDAKRSLGERRSSSFWWGSSLTGVATVMAIVAVVNLNEPESEIAVTETPIQAFAIPQFTWKPKPALLTQSLEQELVDIQSDLKKAERAVREDLNEIM